MIENWVGLLIAYVLFGLLTCWLARKGWPDEWDEALLASFLGPPLLALLATACTAHVVRAGVRRVAQTLSRGTAVK